MSSNNVIYGFQIGGETTSGKTIIDSNSLASELIGKQEKAYKEKLLAEERARRLKEMEETGATIPEGVDPDEFLGLADAIAASEEPEEEEEQVDESVVEEMLLRAQEEAERIIAQAQAKAQEIVSEAELNAEALKNLAAQEGKKDGYNEGTQQAAHELQEAQNKMDAQLSRMRDEYTQAALTMEQDIVEMCIPVFEKVFNAELAGRKDVIYHLLNQCVMNIERTGQMQIKVSDANVSFLKSKKDEILSKIGTDTNLDIISDALLGDSECIIETDGGIFDCSIDTELDALLREIKALS